MCNFAPPEPQNLRCWVGYRRRMPARLIVATLMVTPLMREGNAMRAAKNASNASHAVKCTIEKLALVVEPQR